MVRAPNLMHIIFGTKMLNEKQIVTNGPSFDADADRASMIDVVFSFLSFHAIILEVHTHNKILKVHAPCCVVCSRYYYVAMATGQPSTFTNTSSSTI